MNRSSRKVNGWVLCCADITRITACRPISRRSTCSGRRLRIAGSSRFGDEASAAASTGRGWIGSRNSGFLVPALFILGRSSALLSGPEIRAQCGSSARWDLCGGRLAQSRVNRPYRDHSVARSPERIIDAHDEVAIDCATSAEQIDSGHRPYPSLAGQSPASRLRLKRNNLLRLSS